MKKLFACDLDGTLLNAKHDTDSYINEGLRKVISSNNPIAIATGRSYYQVTMIDFPKGIYAICANGALIFDPQGNLIYKNTIDKKIIQEIVAKFPHLPIEYVSTKNTYCTTSKEEFIKNLYMEDTHRPGMTDNLAVFLSNDEFNVCTDVIINRDISKISLFVRRGIDKEFKEFMEQHKDSLVNAATNDGIIELTSASVNKGESVHFLAKHLGIPDNQVIVYGDAGNDVEMLKKFKYAYVPSSGFDIAKKYAYQIIGENKDYSVIHHILKEIE